MDQRLEALRRRIERLTRLSAATQSAGAAIPHTDLLDWTSKYLWSIKSAPYSQFHRWLCAELDSLPPAGKLVVQAPRGNAKSSFASLAFPLRQAVEGRERFIILTSDTYDQARDFLRQIRREVETNETLRAAYPNCRPGSVWRDARISLPPPGGRGEECEIVALGTGGKIRGRKSAANRRPSLVVVDDPQNKDHIQSATRRARSLEWLRKDVLSAGDPHTRYVVVGTALHREAIVCELARTPGWRSRVWRSVLSWPERMDLWREWESLLHGYDLDDAAREARARQFLEANRPEMWRGAEVLWPEHEPLEQLMLKRASDGHAAFESEKQNNPSDPASCEWPEEYLDHPGMWFDKWPEALAVRTVSLDPSKGRDARTGDYSAIVRYGVDSRGVEYVEADLARRSVDVQCHDLARHCQEHRPDGVAVEVNQFQELMVEPIRQAATALRIEIPIYKVDHTTAKIVRIRRLTTPLAQKRMRFKTRSPGTQLLVEQMRDVPNGAHDDGPDALASARDLALQLAGGKAIRPRGR